jgi:hypothetical protein
MNGAERSHSIEEWLHIVDISSPACQGKCVSLPFGDGLNCSGNTDPAACTSPAKNTTLSPVSTTLTPATTTKTSEDELALRMRIP